MKEETEKANPFTWLLPGACFTYLLMPNGVKFSA